MGFDFGVLILLRSWFGFMQECEERDRIDEELALQRHLETLDEEELRKLLDE